MRQTVKAKVESDRSLCCGAALDRAAFSDGRGFVICSACGKVLAVESKAPAPTKGCSADLRSGERSSP